MGRSLVAAIPAYDCAATVPQVVGGCLEHLDGVVVVDDGSRDGTAEAARRAGARVESLPANRGKGYALRRAIALALEDDPAAVALLDADGQHHPGDLPQLVAAWERGAELVIGTRWGDAASIPRPRYWNNYVGTRILSWMTGRQLEDSQSGFRMATSELLSRLELVSDGYAIETEMLIKAARLGARIEHVPIRVIYDGQQSHFRPLADTWRICRAAVYHKVFDDS